jgi:hypothetical protein
MQEDLASYFPAQKSGFEKRQWGPELIEFWFGTGMLSGGAEERAGSHAKLAPMLMRLSPITPRPTHLFMPAVPL